MKNLFITILINYKFELSFCNFKSNFISSKANKFYKTIAYTADGEYILAGGNSKYVNLYDIKTRLLMKKYLLTSNRSLDGILKKLNSKGVKDGKVISEINDEDFSDYEVIFYIYILNF